MVTKRANLVVPFVAGVCLCAVIACTESVHTKPVPDSTRDILEKGFLLSEVLEIVKGKTDHTTVARYFTAKAGRYGHIGSERQGEMTVEGYSVLDSASPIIGYSLYFHDASGSLTIIDATVNPLDHDAKERTDKLIAKAFDSVDAGGNSQLHFLGIYNLDEQRVLKIMVRSSRAGFGSDYAIRYAISQK